MNRLLTASLLALCVLLGTGPAFRAQEKQDEPADKKEKKDLPLEPDRTIAFDTSEGSWISLDVAPDGRSIVFELLGDLYTVPIDGGPATRITSGMMFDSQPRYSPDGSKIVFLSDRSGDENIWIAKPRRHRPQAAHKGQEHALLVARVDARTASTSSCRAPPAAPSGTQLWLYHVDGGSGVNLTGSEERRQLNPLGAAFGKDDRFVYFTERTAAGSVYNQMNFRWQLGVYDRQTGENFRMSDELGSAMRPVLSPDGRWLVYATRWDAQTGLRVRDLKSGDDSWLIYPVTRDDQESASHARPDARFVVHAGLEGADHVVRRKHLARRGAVGRSHRRSRSPRRSSRRSDRRSSSSTRWTKARCARSRSAIRGSRPMARSLPSRRSIASGSWITQAASRAASAHRMLASISRRGRPTGASSPTSAGPTRRRTRLPSGRRRRHPAEADRSLLVLFRSGLLTRRPAHRRRARAARRAAGGLLAVGPRRPGDGHRLASGGRRRRRRSITPFRGEGRPHFAKDPNRIYAWEGSRGLVSFRWDGTDRKTHVKVTGYKNPNAEQASNASEVLMGPDGEHALAEAQHHVYLLTVPVKGGDAPTVALASPDGAAVPVQEADHGGRRVSRLGRGAARRSRSRSDGPCSATTSRPARPPKTPRSRRRSQGHGNVRRKGRSRKRNQDDRERRGRSRPTNPPPPKSSSRRRAPSRPARSFSAARASSR